MNPFREGAPVVPIHDADSERAAGYDAWSVWLNSEKLAKLPDNALCGVAKIYMRDAIKVLSERLERMK